MSDAATASMRPGNLPGHAGGMPAPRYTQDFRQDHSCRDAPSPTAGALAS